MPVDGDRRAEGVGRNLGPLACFFIMIENACQGLHKVAIEVYTVLKPYPIVLKVYYFHDYFILLEFSIRDQALRNKEFSFHYGTLPIRGTVEYGSG